MPDRCLACHRTDVELNDEAICIHCYDRFDAKSLAEEAVIDNACIECGGVRELNNDGLCLACRYKVRN